MAAFEEKIKGGSFTLREWESYPVERENFESLRGVISPREKGGMKELDVYDFHGPRIKAKGYVGGVGFDPPIPIKTGNGEAFLKQIVVWPKIVRDEHDREGWVNFLHLFEIAYGLSPLTWRGRVEALTVLDPRVVVAVMYAVEVEALFRRYLRRSFVIREGRLEGRVRGKLLLGRYVRESVARGKPQIAVCQFYELTPDTLLNRIVKAGLKAARRLVTSVGGLGGWSDLSGSFARLTGFMMSVEDVRVTAADFARIRLHAQNRHYLPALNLARMLIFEKCFDYVTGDRRVRGFFLDMNKLFERFVAGLLRRRFRQGAAYQKRIGAVKFKPRYPSTSEEVISERKLRPDVTVLWEGRPVIVDAKYKELFEQGPGGEEEDSPAAEIDAGYGEDYPVKPRLGDLYQMASYLANCPDARAGVLVYPMLGKGVRVSHVEGLGESAMSLVALGLGDIETLVTGVEFDWFEKAITSP